MTYLEFVGLAYVVGLASVTVTAHGSVLSVWWPAAGAAVLAVIAAPRRWYVPAAGGLWLMTGLSNYLAGRPLGLSTAYGFANAAEALLVAWLLTRGRRRPGLETLRDVGRLLTATVAGATLAGVLAGASVALLSDGAFLTTAVRALASHGSAVLAIVPVALAGSRPRGGGARWQQIAQPVVLTAVVLLVFSPGHNLPLAFLPMPFLVWGTFQFATRYVALELLVVAFVVTTVTTLGGGPFAGSSSQLDELERVTVLQSFLVTYTASILVFSAARNERLRLAERLAEREQLLRGGILDAQVGLVIMHERADGTVHIIQSNERAATLLSPAIPLVDTQLGNRSGPVIDLAPADASPLVTAILSTREAANGEWYDEFAVGDDDARRVELFITRVPQPYGEALLTAQVVDVTERHRSDVAVRRALTDERLAAEHLRDLNRQKDDFVSAVSHELRTPITSIIGFVEVLTDDGGLTTDQQEYLTIVDRNARRLSTLVEDLLALGAGGARRSDPTVSTDVPELCAEAVEELVPFASDHGVELVLTTHRAVHARVGRGDLTRILANLVTNAVKFTPPGGTVTIDVDARPERCVLTVTDTGVGIQPELLDKVFGRFYRTARAEEDSVPGAGLGLALVRELVEACGGTVELHSDGVHGTQAVVLLPHAALTPDSVEP